MGREDFAAVATEKDLESLLALQAVSGASVPFGPYALRLTEQLDIIGRIQALEDAVKEGDTCA